MIRKHAYGYSRVLMHPDDWSWVRRIPPTGQVKAVLHVVAYVLDDLLREPAPEQPMCFLWPGPAYAGRLYRGLFVAIQLPQSKAGRQ
jgi:hypothetical protein